MIVSSSLSSLITFKTPSTQETAFLHSVKLLHGKFRHFNLSLSLVNFLLCKVPKTMQNYRWFNCRWQTYRRQICRFTWSMGPVKRELNFFCQRKTVGIWHSEKKSWNLIQWKIKAGILCNEKNEVGSDTRKRKSSSFCEIELQFEFDVCHKLYVDHKKGAVTVTVRTALLGCGWFYHIHNIIIKP